MSSEFERALEAIFGERHAQLSESARELLQALWKEGVKQGRIDERMSEGTRVQIVLGEKSKPIQPPRDLKDLQKLLAKGDLHFHTAPTHLLKELGIEPASPQFRREIFGKWDED